MMAQCLFQVPSSCEACVINSPRPCLAHEPTQKKSFSLLFSGILSVFPPDDLSFFFFLLGLSCQPFDMEARIAQSHEEESRVSDLRASLQGDPFLLCLSLTNLSADRFFCCCCQSSAATQRERNRRSSVQPCCRTVPGW